MGALPPASSAAQPPLPSFPVSNCDLFKATSPGGPLNILQTVAVEGVTPPEWLYLLQHAPESPTDIEAAMTRTEAMMAAAYKHILLQPYWAGVPNAVVEVGVHGGWFATLAYKFGGHRVIGFDMQPACVAVARCTLQVNGASAAASVVLNRYVSHGSASVDVSSSSCGGGLGVGNRARGEVAVQPVHLAQFFQDPANLAALALDPAFEVPILKSDTEGFEGIVLETVLPLLGRVHNVLVEVFGMRWKMHGLEEARVMAVFECLHAAGMDEMVDLPRRDIDFLTPGDIDLAAPPPERVHSTWAAWQGQLRMVLAEKNGLINPNVWLRWSSQARRKALDIHGIPECKGPLAQNSYKAP